MDFDEENYVVDRTESFPQERAKPSRSGRSQIPKRSTEDSLFDDRQPYRRGTGDSFLDDRQPHRRGTGDFEPRRRLRYTIPLRHNVRPLGDEEKGYSERSTYGRRHSTRSDIDREISRDSAASAAPEFLEIISTNWVPDDEGREIVNLTVKDGGRKADQEDLHCESRWKHIKSDAMTLAQFYGEVMRTPGLGNDDMALVARLLNKVRNISEKKFVHGRYLKSITLVYDGEDPDIPASHSPEERHVRKSATFVSLPVFTFDCPQRHTSTKEFEGHPVRALLQSRYRLESTKRRDKEQVITKTTSFRDQLAPQDHVVHVPQIWALMVNNYTIFTCAALDASFLRADTIKLMSYTAAQSDEATWSVHFTDARGKDFYLPLRFCKTWFDLVKQITDHCLHDEYSFIRDQLLKGGPVYQLTIASDGTAVNAEKWSKLIEETKTEVIHLRLVDNERVPSRLLVTYCDDEGNEIITDSDESPDTSPIFSSDDGADSDDSESSTSSGTNSDNMTRAIDRLRSLQTKLREAESKGDAKKVENLRAKKIPAQEGKVLELNATGLDLDLSTDEDAPKRSKITVPGPYVHEPRLNHGLDHDSPLRPIERYRTRLRSRSRSTSRPRLVRKNDVYSGSAYDLSIEEPHTRGRASQPWIIHDRNGSIPRSRYFRDIKYDIASRPRPRIHSHMPNTQSLSKTSSWPTHSRSRWDLLRSHVRNKELPGLQSTPVPPMTEGDDIYYRPSEKQLARSYWDLVRTSVLEGGIQRLRDAEGVPKDETVTISAKESVKNTVSKARKSLSSLTRLSEVLDGSPNSSSAASPTIMDMPPSSLPPKAVSVPVKGVSSLDQGGIEPTKPKKVLFSKDGPESKPKLKLKRLVKLARKESAALPKIATSPAALGISSPISAHATGDLPIFLWATDHKQHEMDNLASRSSHLSTIIEAPTPKSSVPNPAEEPKQTTHTSKMEELILHAVLAEVHNALKKPKRVAPEYAVLYEKTEEKAYADVVASVNAVRNSGIGITNGAAVEERTVNYSVNNLRRASLSFAGLPRRQTESNRSVASMSGPDDLGAVKWEIFDLARTILLAFVPKGYEAPVISKYWGALHSLLLKNETVLRYVRSRLSEICNLIQSIQMGVRAEDGSKQQRYQIPRALPAAFQRLVLLLVVISSISNWSEYSWNQMRSTFDDCEGLLVEGRKQLLLMIHTDDYRFGFQAVNSEALLSLILANLISSMSPEGDFHLTEVYAEYTTRIQGIVRDSASVKVYDDIKLLREEVDIIKSTLVQQDTTLREFKSTIPLTYGVASLSVAILDRTLDSISQRIDDFDELQSQAETARFLAAQSISLKAESNGKAIIVFTVVTIVFLPLSFVTSYLGMNTSDLRDMESGQALFWAIGAPVAFGVLGVAVAAAFWGTLTQRVTQRALWRAWMGKEKAE